MRKFRILVYENDVLCGVFNILGTIADCFKISSNILKEHPSYRVQVNTVFE